MPSKGPRLTKGLGVRSNIFLQLFLAGTVPMALASVAAAQGAAAPEASVSSATSVSPASAPPADAAAAESTPLYDIKSTSFSGSLGATSATILTAPVPLGAAAYKLENGLYLYPTVKAGYGYDDNVLQTTDNAIATSYYSLAPQVVAEMKNHGDRYTGSAALNRTNYLNSSADNFTNSDLHFAADNIYSVRASSGLSVGLVNGIDPRGSNDLAVQAVPNQWQTANIDGRFIYGAREAKGRIEIDAGSQSKTYQNNLSSTAAYDVNQNSVAGRFFVRVGTQSMALVEVRNDFFSYPNGAINNNAERHYFAGLTWEATAATTGLVKLGQMTKDFGDGSRGSYAGGSWEAQISWQPLTYSSWVAHTSRAAADTTGYGNFVINSSADASWIHRWNAYISSNVGISSLQADYQGTGITRADTTNTVALGLQYQVQRWLRLGFSLSNAVRSSNTVGYAYNRNIALVTLDASL